MPATQDIVRLSTNNGMTGYRIVKFQVMPHAPGDNNDQELICMIWKMERTGTQLADTTTTRPNFADPNLLGVSFVVNDISSHINYAETTVFDNEVFNQDIFVTARDIAGGSQSLNYYIELEEIKLNENSQAVATLKDIRAHTL